MATFTSLAAEYGLKSHLLDTEEWLPAAPPDSTLNEPKKDDPFTAIDRLRRRGLDPDDVEILWKLFEVRPLELGLLAWDVLSNSLLPKRADLRRYQEAARKVRGVLPAAPKSYAATEKMSAGELVRKLALPAFQSLSDAQMSQASKFNALGGLEAVEIMVREHGRPRSGTQALHAAHQFATFLSLAHLPTLATFYLDYLAHRCEYRPALADWFEAMLDAGAGIKLDQEHLLNEADVDELELNAYALARPLIDRDVPELFLAWMKGTGPLPDYKARPAAEMAKDRPRSTLVVAHGLLTADEPVPVPFELINEIVKQNPGWRYAGRVRLAMLAHVSPKNTDLPLRVFDQFVGTFGNDLLTWRDFDTYTKPGSAWLDGMYARSVREVEALPHDRAAWGSLEINLDFDKAKEWQGQIATRIVEQCQLD